VNARRRKAETYLLLVTIIWGSTFVITKSFLGEIPPLYYTAFRYLLSSIILLALFRRRLLTVSSLALKKGLVLGVILYVGFAFQTIGLQYTTASKSAFFTGLLVVLTPIVHAISRRFLNLRTKELKVGNIVGVVCAAVGLYLLTSPSGSAVNGGDMLTIVCAILFALYIVYLDYASDVPDKLQLTYVQFVFCGVAGLPIAFFSESFVWAFSAQFLLSLFYLSIFATIIAIWVQNQFQADTTPTRAAVIFAMEPVVAGLFAYVIRGENIGVAGVIGGVVMIAGLLLSELSDSLPLLNRPVRRSGPDPAITNRS
jgi:drug/metabolite transporter (DMT)-like permease